jgi:hypothetical protein
VVIPAFLRHVAAGTALGLVTGAVARGFMALLTQDPQFSWSGTGFILGLFAVAGLCLSTVWHLKGRHRSRWWKLLALPTAMLGFGPGFLMVPGTIAFALVGGRRWWTRAAGAAALVGQLALLVWAVTAAEGAEPVTARTFAGLAILLGCCWALGRGLRVALSGWASSDQAATGQPQRERGDRTQSAGDGRSAEHPLDLDDGGVEQRLGVGLVR